VIKAIIESLNCFIIGKLVVNKDSERSCCDSLVVVGSPDDPRETGCRSGEAARHLETRANRQRNLENSIIDYALIC
jgi:hypothetical protein